MEKKLSDVKVAILVTDGFEQIEMTEPKKALDQSGAKTFIISPAKGKVKGWKHTEWGDQFPIDVSLQAAKPEDYDALLLPGGVMNPDKLRMDPQAVKFIKAFVESKKPIAAICHGPWTLIEADGVEGKAMTSWPSIKTDLINAGANWQDKQVITDENLVTSRKPDDIPAFNKAMIELFAQIHQRG